jgi:hypothetical protein
MGGRGSASGMAPATPSTPSGKTLADIQAMARANDDKGMHDFLIDVQNTDTPDFLNTHHLQKMVYALGMNDKPEIVSQQEFDDMTVNAPFGSGQPILYRTVNDVKLTGGVHMSAKQINDMMISGDLTYLGNGIHGDGLYFANDKAESQAYGYGGGRSRTIACVLNSKARMVTETKLRKEYDDFVKHNPQTRKALGFAKAHSSHDSMSQFALMKGYNVIVSSQFRGVAYYTVIDRSVLTTTGKQEKY